MSLAPQDVKFAAALRLLSKRVAVLEARAGIVPAPNVMHDNRPEPRVEHSDTEPRKVTTNGPNNR